MSGVNKVILVGRLGKDPEVRFTSAGQACANFTMATSEEWKDKSNGEKKEKTEWHRIVVWGKLAEIAGKHLKKGAQVYIEGRLQTRKWSGTDGKDNYTTEVVTDQLVMLGSKKDSEPSLSPPPAAAPEVSPKPFAGFETADIPF